MLHRIFPFIMIICFNSMCTLSQTKIKFNDIESLKELNEDDTTSLFVLLCINKEFEKCELIYPEITDIDVSAYMSVGENHYMLGVGEFINKYTDNSEKLLAAAVYFRSKYLLRVESYDNLLRIAISLNRKNYIAVYLLARLRYQYHYNSDAKYLINYLKTELKASKEIDRLYSEFKNNDDSNEIDIDFKEFLNNEVRYSDFLRRN